LRATGESERTVEALFADLAQIFMYLAHVLPLELVQALSTVMVPDVISKVTSTWLNTVVPASLADMDGFQGVMESAREFCGLLSGLGYSGFGELQEWVESTPKVWLSKCREVALDAIRVKLSQGE
jgi:centromere/kinetochore protein ZW10